MHTSVVCQTLFVITLMYVQCCVSADMRLRASEHKKKKVNNILILCLSLLLTYWGKPAIHFFSSKYFPLILRITCHIFWLNPILRGIISNLFYVGGRDICPHMIFRKKGFLPNSFCTPKQLPKIGSHTKNRYLPQKTKKWRPF